MRGLALEGGSAKGAYHIGVAKALYEEGYTFDGFVGTSIGAINAAILAAGDLEKALEVWPSITMEQIFDEDEHPILQLAHKKALRTDFRLLSSARRKALVKILENKGINTEKMKAFLGQYIDEEKVRASGKDFGLVTISLSERKPRELMKEDIPAGQLFNYIMASAALPVFRPESIDDSVYLDGGFYNNCPYHLLLDKGYDEVIVVRTNAVGIFRKVDDPRVKCIIPSDDIRRIFLFSPESSTSLIQLGYYDGLRFARGLLGSRYYINPDYSGDFGAKLMSLNDEAIYKAGGILNIPKMPAKRMLFEKIIPKLGTYMKLDKDFDYRDFAIALLEHAAKDKDIERFCLYDFDDFCALVRDAQSAKNEGKPRIKLTAPSLTASKKAAVELLGRYLL